MNASEPEQWIPNVDPKDDFLFAVSNKSPVADRNLATSSDCSVADSHIAPVDAAQTNEAWLTYSMSFQTERNGTKT
jgi:hypothetical protein